MTVRSPWARVWDVGCASARGGSPEELIARADGALYQAKHAGRNRTLAA